MSRASAQSSMAVTSAPDCEMKANCPGRAGMCAKLAFSPVCGASRPTQLGPRMRIRRGRAMSSMACFCSADRPAVMTTTAWVPRWASWRISSTTVAGGVQITASSGASGSWSTRA